MEIEHHFNLLTAACLAKILDDSSRFAVAEGFTDALVHVKEGYRANVFDNATVSLLVKLNDRVSEYVLRYNEVGDRIGEIEEPDRTTGAKIIQFIPAAARA